MLAQSVPPLTHARGPRSENYLAWAHLHGKMMIASHHGDKAKLSELPGIFAADFAELWGKAVYRVCHEGQTVGLSSGVIKPFDVCVIVRKHRRLLVAGAVSLIANL